MNSLEGIIEDVEKSNLVSDKVIRKVRELIGQEKWQELHDEESDIITTTGELLIILKSTKELQEEIEQLKAVSDYQTDLGDKYAEENEKLKKINSETISELNHINGDLIIKLEQAKEIIKQLLLLPYANNEEVHADVTTILDKAEQFLKE